MSKKLIVIGGIVVVAAVVIAIVFMQDTRHTSPKQTINQSENSQTNQQTQDATAGMYGNGTSILPQQAFDSNPYP